ncbi:hypothetical protein EDC14_1001252 [Hydrogenispora ethanolica]|jgi:hypothetical protein|uniref:Attachment p12 family protein n=1 Tax=Hydrogenispora ethanolica TaxID=1082276 RepID=A0A4V2QGS4_HYDET|nr:hypothetical protein [Hydrogenispora ethanolica]TCL76967.1 hypothetical protein EDC14_1001252 [Hydrogenispora ethanolica]
MDKLILIATVVVLVGLAAWYINRSLKKGGCDCECGDSANCPGCGHHDPPK